MSFMKCVVSLNLGGKLPARELKDDAAEYEKQGHAPDEAMVRAVADKLEMARMEERNIVGQVRRAYEAQGGKPRPQPAPLDHGELNIPGRTNGINAELDRYKANQAKEAKTERKSKAAQNREDKARAKELFAEVGEALLDKHGDKLGRKELDKELDSMVKWEPAKFIRLAEKFKSEQAADRPLLDPGNRKTDESTGLPLNDDGTVTVYHHTSKEAAEQIARTGRLKSEAEPDVYVTTHRDTDTGYGDTAVPVRVKPEHLQLDDEFPNGRKDFRIDTGRPGGSVKVAVDKGGEHFDRATREQARNEATNRAVDYALRRADGLDAEPLARTSALLKLRQAFHRLEAGTEGEHADELFRARVEALLGRLEEKSATKQAERMVAERQRGPDLIREKLLAAKRRGDISPETADMADWFIRQNPALVDELGLSVRSFKGDGNAPAGQYNPLSRVMTLFKGAANDTTAVHEILHHFERLMPRDMQDAIRAEYLKQVGKMLADKSTPQAAKDYLHAALEGYATGDSKTMQKAEDLLGKAPDGLYQYFNPSEFWAVNGARLMERRYSAEQGGVWSKIADWTRNAVEHIKGALGLASDAPVLKALGRVLGGESGAMPEGARMLSDAKGFNEDTRTIEVDGERRPITNSEGEPIAPDFGKQKAFWKWAGDTKAVDGQGRPLIMYHGTGAEFDSFDAKSNIWFTQEREYAQRYAGEEYDAEGGDGKVVEAYLAVKKPLVIDADLETGPEELHDILSEIGLDPDEYMNMDTAWSVLDQPEVQQAIRAAGYDGIKTFEQGYATWAAFRPEQIKSTDNGGDFDGSSPHILYDRTGTRTPEQKAADEEARTPPEPVTPVDEAKLSALLKIPRDALHSAASNVRQLVLPITDGSMHAMAMAKDFASRNRKAEAQWAAFDKILVKNFTEPQLEDMWHAADEENDLRSNGKTATDKGLNRLPADQRETVELLSSYGKALWGQAGAQGLVEGDGVAYWTPRVAARIYADGTVEDLRSGNPGEPSKDARNLRTSASSMKQRKFATTAEAEAAGKVSHGEDFAFVKNIRVMPKAMAELERAIAGRALVNQIKAHGQVLGEDLFSDTGDKNFVLIDHPALKRWQPKIDWLPADMAKVAAKGLDVRADGVYKDGEQLASYRVKDGEVQQRRALEDETGKPVMTSSPLYVRRDFAGPLKAVFTREPNKVYQGAMQLKGAVTSMIMVSPLTHNLVIWGKAFPTMATMMGWRNNMANIATLGLRPYFTGHAVRQDHATMSDLIEHGLVPVSGRGMNPDLPAIANGIEPGRSLLAKGLGKVGDVAGKNVGDALRSGVDAAGHFWHETLLWDRIADMQAGMAVMMRQSLLDKGLDQKSASYIATHFANRYAGMIPREAISNGAHVVANLALFSKSFTLTNIGAYRDVLGGLPKEVQAQVKLRAIEVQRAMGKSEAEAEKAAGKVLTQAQKATRAKAVTVLALEIGAMATVNSLVQSAMQGQDWQDIKAGFGERLSKLGVKLHDDPLSVLKNPLDSLSSLSETSGNPHGKEDRVRIGEDEDGNSYYARLPVGKVGEELKAYSNLESGLHLLHSKMSTFIKPIADLTQNEDFQGRRIIKPGDPILKQVGGFVGYWIKSQLPVDDLSALKHMAQGTADKMDKAKLLGTATGLTVGKVAGGDAVAELRYASHEQQAKLRDVLPDVREAMRRGDPDKAYDLLESAGETPHEIRSLMRQMDNPDKLSKSALKKFRNHASDDEVARMDKLRK